MMPFGTNALRHLNRKELAAKYSQVRAAVFATDYGRKFKDAADFDSFIEHYVSETGIRRERSRVLCAFGQLHLAYTVTKFLAPSPETLAWGGFLGGEHVHNTKRADEVCLSMLQG